MIKYILFFSLNFIVIVMPIQAGIEEEVNQTGTQINSKRQTIITLSKKLFECPEVFNRLKNLINVDGKYSNNEMKKYLNNYLGYFKTGFVDTVESEIESEIKKSSVIKEDCLKAALIRAVTQHNGQTLNSLLEETPRNAYYKKAVALSFSAVIGLFVPVISYKYFIPRLQRYLQKKPWTIKSKKRAVVLAKIGSFMVGGLISYVSYLLLEKNITHNSEKSNKCYSSIHEIFKEMTIGWLSDELSKID